jgi:non-specific serine/threonine protein kinase
LREALSLFRAVDYDWAVAVCACALGTALRCKAAMDEPAALFGEAIELYERHGDQRGVARCLDGLADLCLARGAAATAGRLRGAATARRHDVAARPSDWEQGRLDRLDAAITAALGQAGAQREQQAGRTMPAHLALSLASTVAGEAQAPASAIDITLTGRQVEVAALVAAGSTNRQIARALGISEKTAEVHVRNIMERLRTPSRAGIAAWAVTHGVRPSASP